MGIACPATLHGTCVARLVRLFQMKMGELCLTHNRWRVEVIVFRVTTEITGPYTGFLAQSKP
jgi:hypothetical protein